MGLTLRAVNKDYGYDEVSYEEKETNECYLSTDIGYMGFMKYRMDITKYFGCDKYYEPDGFGTSKDCFLGSFETYFYRDVDGKLVLNTDEADESDNFHPEFKNYLLKLEKHRKEPYFDLIPLMLHSDCDGEMPLEDVMLILPKVKEFHNHCRKSKQNYGYSAWEYSFIDEFEKVLELVVEKKGKLIFS